MDARFALSQQTDGVAERPLGRRFTVRVEALAALLGSAVAGLLLMAPLMAPLALGGPADSPILQTDLLVPDLPRAAASGAAFAVVSAALLVALGRRSAWITSCGSAVALLVDEIWKADAGTTVGLATANYVACIFGGILLGALAVAVLGKPIAMGAYLIGALGAILIGDQTSVPSSGGRADSPIQWAADGTLPTWVLLLTVMLLAAGFAVQNPEPATQDENTDLAIGPILSVLVVVTATVLSTEWLVRHEGTATQIGIAAAVTISAAMIAALLLPGREGTLVLLAVAVANSGSAVIAVPRPDWTAPLPIVAVVVGLAAGRWWRSPWAALVATGGLAVFAALTAGPAHQYAVIPVLGVLLTALAVGFCFGVAVPRTAGSTVVAIAVMIVPCLVVALRGGSFGRVAYSPRWYRDPHGAVSAMPGWMALVVSVGCAAGVYLLWRIRSPRDSASSADRARNVMPQRATRPIGERTGALHPQ